MPALLHSPVCYSIPKTEIQAPIDCLQNETTYYCTITKNMQYLVQHLFMKQDWRIQ
jgi:hypothetical protein